MNKSMTVSGMTCHKDRAHAKTLIESFAGISNVHVEGNTASFDYDETADLKKVKEVLESLGFRVE